MRKFKYLLLFIVSIYSINAFSQKDTIINKQKKWFVGLDLGVQMSGIKSEDFVKSNYSSLIRVTTGKWFNSKFGAQLGFQGRYFNAIADNDKHFYDFYFIEGLANVKNILFPNSNSKFHELLFHAGLGYFQNHYYGNSTVHGVLGASNNFSISNNIKLKLDLGAIVGWDIYQGDDDILPSLSLGLIYIFK